MPKTFFEDYDPCEECGRDHDYDYQEAVQIHVRQAYTEARDSQLDRYGPEQLKLPIDPRAYVHGFGMLILIICLLSAGVYFYIQEHNDTHSIDLGTSPREYDPLSYP